MAVYIKNMKKPERCGCCRFTSAFDCRITGEFIEDHNQILDSCPIVETPTTEQSSMVGEWIPCSERLPEEREWIGTKKFGTTISDEVLVTFESRGERFVRPIHFQNGELGGMDKHTMDAVHGEWKAVAWMPLPKPWKGAGDERSR